MTITKTCLWFKIYWETLHWPYILIFSCWMSLVLFLTIRETSFYIKSSCFIQGMTNGRVLLWGHIIFHIGKDSLKVFVNIKNIHLFHRYSSKKVSIVNSLPWFSAKLLFPSLFFISFYKVAILITMITGLI